MADTAPQPSLMIDHWGDVQEIAPDQLHDALAAGYVAASPKQIGDYQLEQKYGGLGQAAVTGLEGAADALTFGLSTGAERLLGVPAEDIAGREVAHPVAHGIGTAAGIAAPLILSAGAAAPAEGAAAVARGVAKYAAPSLIARTGQAVTKSVAGILPEAEGTLGRLVSRAVSSGAGSFVEGAAYGAGQVVHEAALGDPGLTGESVVAHVLLGGALGGALGGIIGAGEIGLPAAVEKAREAANGVMNRAKGIAETAIPGVAEKLTGVSKETISELWANRHEILRDPGVRTKLASDFTSALQDQYTNVERALKAANRDIRPVESEVFTAGIPPMVAQNEAYRTLAKFDTAIEAMRAQPELYPAMYAKKLELIRDGFGRNVLNTDAHGVFSAINEAKQNLDPLAKFGRNIPPEHADAIAAVKALRADLKNSLQSEAAWGEAGARQASFNEAQNEYLTVQKEFQKRFMQKGTTKTGAIEYKLDPVKVNTFFNQMADTRGQFRSEILDRYMGSSRHLLDEIENSYRNAPVGQFDRAALDDLVNKTGDLTVQARKQASVTQMLNQLGPHLSWGSMPISNGATGTAGALLEIAGGHMVGGPLGAALGAAHTVYKFAKDIPRAVATLASLERVVQSVGRSIDTGVSTLVRGSVKATYVGRSEATAGLARSFGHSAEDAKALYLKRVAEINRLSNPDQLHEVLSRQTDDLHEHAPDTSTALQATTARAVGFLASKLPQTPQLGPLAPEWRPSTAEVAKFSRYYEAVNNPLLVLKQASAGRLTPEAVESLQVVYPKLLEKIHGSIVDKLASHPKGVPYKSSLMLSLLTGQSMDGTTGGLPILRNQATLGGSLPSAPVSPAIKPSSKGASGLTLSDRALTPMQKSASRK